MKKTLVLSLDFINDIVHLDGKIAHSAQRIKENRTIENANKVIQWGRKNNFPIAHVRVGFSANYLECPKTSPMFSKSMGFGALNLESWGCEFHENLDVQKSDFIVTKHRVNAFYQTDLEALLRAQKIERIVLFGVSTNYAVEHTARDAHDRDYEVVVIKDASEALTDEAHVATLNSIGRFSEILEADQL